MPITINIVGDNAAEAQRELQTLARIMTGTAKPTVEERLVARVGVDKAAELAWSDKSLDELAAIADGRARDGEEKPITALRTENERLRAASIASGNALYEARTRNAELVKALEASRQVLAKFLSAGHIFPPPTPEEIDAAFRFVDSALKGQSNE